MSDIVERLRREATALGENDEETKIFFYQCGIMREAAAEISALRARAEIAEKERDDLRAENNRLVDENSDLRNEPWPEWATAVLKVIRTRSGYDGYDDASDGVDLPAELEKCFSELEREAEQAKKLAEDASGWALQIAGHLDCEPDSESILHTIREIEADKGIYKDRAEAAEAALAEVIRKARDEAFEEAAKDARLGFVVAATIAAFGHGQDTVAKEILTAAGITTMQDLIDSGADEYDQDKLSRLFEQGDDAP